MKQKKTNEYRIKEVQVDGDWTWTPQFRPAGSKSRWFNCKNKDKKPVYRISEYGTRHWLLWEEGAELYPDAGTGDNRVGIFDRNNVIIPERTELYEKDELAKQTEEAKVSDSDFDRQQLLMVCNCGDVSHQFVVILDHYKDCPPEVFVEIKLNPLPFWKRLVHGIKYIFGYKCRFGDFDEVTLDKGHIEGLQKTIEVLKEMED